MKQSRKMQSAPPPRSTKLQSAASASRLKHATSIRVTYHDTDRMGHVYYANYLVWFEMGRTELLREMGMCYRDWEEIHRIFLPVSSCWIDYKRSAQYDDVVRVETTITHITKASVTFSYEILHDRTDELLARGETRHAFVGQDGRIARVADKLLPQLFE